MGLRIHANLSRPLTLKSTFFLKRLLVGQVLLLAGVKFLGLPHGYVLGH